MITQAQSFATLRNRKCINLTTFRRTGAAVATPLWFAVYQGVLYTQTFPAAGKLKRIKHTPRVTVAPSTINGKALGAEIEGEARIITNEQEILLAEAALARKYGLTRRIYYGAMSVYGKLRRQAPTGRTYITIEPVTSTHYSPHLQAPSSSRSLPRNHMSVVPLFFNWQ